MSDRNPYTDETFPAYLEAIHEEAERAWREYELLVIPGAEVDLVDIAITLYRNGAWNRKDRKAAKGAPVAVPASVAN